MARPPSPHNVQNTLLKVGSTVLFAGDVVNSICNNFNATRLPCLIFFCNLFLPLSKRSSRGLLRGTTEGDGEGGEGNASWLSSGFLKKAILQEETCWADFN